MRLPVLLLAVLVIAALGGTIAFLHHRRKEQQRILEQNELDAGHALELLRQAEEQFRIRDLDRNGIQDYWTGDVAGLFHHQLIPESIAGADAAPLRPSALPRVPFAGYWLVAMDSLAPSGQLLRQDTDGTSGKVHHRSRFAFCAYPAHYGETGRNTFVISEHGTVTPLDSGGKPALRYPDHPFDHRFQPPD